MEKDLRKWYRCETRREMVELIKMGFDYTNFRPDKFNKGKNVYYFERTDELEKAVVRIKGKIKEKGKIKDKGED
jgi:hypothetical protein